MENKTLEYIYQLHDNNDKSIRIEILKLKSLL